MTDKTTPVSRRRVLASVGTAGLAGLGLQGTGLTHTPPRYTDKVTVAAGPDTGVDLQVAWYSTYNDSLVSGRPTDGTDWAAADTDDYLTDAGEAGPVVSAANVLPGDSGVLNVGLLVAGDRPARVRLVPRASGPLADVVDVALRYDTGIFGIGGCQGVGPAAALAGGTTLAEFADTAEEGITLDWSVVGDNCLAPGERLCLGFAWAIDESVGNNWQGAGVSFGLEFAAEACE